MTGNLSFNYQFSYGELLATLSLGNGATVCIIWGVEAEEMEPGVPLLNEFDCPYNRHDKDHLLHRAGSTELDPQGWLHRAGSTGLAPQSWLHRLAPSAVTEIPVFNPTRITPLLGLCLPQGNYASNHIMILQMICQMIHII